ncbi:transcriptional regulator family: Fungal Specific TF [Penicillium capsulatum]|nr:transcriptional regulator family: Fungal Specific TF [Penicillium capsulatum]
MGGTKSKTGCQTCKIRRIRCGEEKPTCLRCSSTGRQCHYNPVSIYTRSIIESPLIQTAFPSSAGVRERRAFEFYFHEAGPSLSGELDLDFWRGSVLQICRLEPLIWDAIISLGALYERPPIHETTPFSLINHPAAVESPLHHEALEWYSRSLAGLQKRINYGEADLTVSLISCVLFIAIELLQGNRKAATTLYHQGSHLLGNALTVAGNMMDSRFYINSGPLASILKPIFRRLGTWVLINSDLSAGSCPVDLISMEGRLESIDEARNMLYDIFAEMKALNVDVEAFWRKTPETRPQEIPALETRTEHLRNRLHRWLHLFQLLQSIRNPHSHQATTTDSGTASLLLMTYKAISIEIETMLSPDQLAYDNHQDEFAQILQLAPATVASTRNPNGKQPPFMFEMGVFLPLFITALKCRFPELRRQALRLLWEAPPAQGMFMCRPTAHVVTILMALEENPTIVPGDLSQVKEMLASPGHMPTAADRIWEFRVSSNMDDAGKTQNWLHYTLQETDAAGYTWAVEKLAHLPGM